MNGLVFYRGTRYEISPLDLAILNDAGVPTFYLAGDYDDDRDVDGADFLMWQQQLGTAVLKNTAADGDGNGFVDAADLAVWQADFGEHFSGAVAATSPIPEPTAIASRSEQPRLRETVHRRSSLPPCGELRADASAPSLETTNHDAQDFTATSTVVEQFSRARLGFIFRL